MSAKNVEYEGIIYNITFESFGYSDSRFCVNDEPTSWCLSNNRLTDINAFKETAKRAIKSYISKQIAQENFDKWDGKL
ncbi:MAG: hypothetical protein WC554_06005 [Clostridia bacterium]